MHNASIREETPTQGEKKKTTHGSTRAEDRNRLTNELAKSLLMRMSKPANQESTDFP